MALVQFVDPMKPDTMGGRITRGMMAPKRVSSLDHWLKRARETIKDIPRAHECIVAYSNASPTGIIWHLTRPDGSRVYVTIDRTKDAFTKL